MTKQREAFRGGWRDNSLSDQARELLHTLPGYTPELETRIGELLGDYRFWQKYRDSVEPTSDQRDRLNDVAEYAEKLIEALKALPPYLAPKVWHQIHDIQGSEPALRPGHLPTELDLIAFICRKGANELSRAQPDRRGAKPKGLELELLSNVAALLEELPGMRVTRAAKLAHEIIIHCGIHTPSDDPRRAVREYRGRN